MTTQAGAADGRALTERRPATLVVLGVAMLWWMVTAEHGQLLGLLGDEAGTAGHFLHELMHDGRHLLGGPCH
jgi:hypothetical protein